MQKEDSCISLSATINDYVEGELTSAHRAIFLNCLASNEDLNDFVHKSEQGKKVLKHAYHVVAAHDFGKKLVRRIASEKTERL